MRIFEVEGDSPEVILNQFMNQQNIPQEFIKYEVIDSGSKGILGIGRRKAKLKISYDEKEHIKKRSRLTLADFLEKAGFDDCHIASEGSDDNIILNIETGSPELLIGKTAQTLDAIQYLMDRILKFDEDSKTTLTIDVAGYRKKNVERAVELAEQVRRTGRTIKLSPMTSSIRKDIHIAIKNINGVSTISTGKGLIKQIMIVSDKKSRPPFRRQVRETRERTGEQE